MVFLGYLQCESCGRYAYIERSDQINIWTHPDDDPLAEAACTHCGVMVSSRIQKNEAENFSKRGINLRPLNEKFSVLTEEMIDEWDIDEELERV